SDPKEFANVNGVLFFQANNGVNGAELWRSNGTAAGTTQVADIRSGSVGSAPEELTNVNGVLFFRADDGTTNGVELWKSNGTSAGTILVKNINSNTTTSSGDSNPKYLTNVNGELFFQADDGTGSGGGAFEVELWKSNGTSAGTTQVANINPTSSSTPVRL